MTSETIAERTMQMQVQVQSRHGLTRRTLLRTGFAGAALWGLGSLGVRQGASAAVTGPEGWQTWLLASADELRPAAPGEPTQAERDELSDVRARQSDETREMVARWNDRPAVLPWTDIALELIKEYKPSPVHASRALALVHVAVSDAVMAATAAQAVYGRPAPDAPAPVSQRLAIPEPSSYPSAHAAVAGAAAGVLVDLFPGAAGELTQLEEEASTSRLWAGVNFRSDLDAGLAIGRTVAAKAIAWGKADGSDAVWDGTRPTGEGAWEPTPPAFIETPLDPLAGTWQTWILSSGDALRPMPPPAWGSALWQAEVAAVQDAVANRTPEQEAAVHFWGGGPGTVTPAGLWIENARDLIVRDGLDLPHAARVLALTSVAMYDAFVCCWDAKFAFWYARPVTADPSLNVLIPTPPFPTYTSGHSTISAAGGTILSYLFPADTDDLMAKANEAKDSRLWAGIHYPIDNEVGATGGAMVGRLVADYARNDDAE
ncbi:MAG: phosphatase PAP2 family protein [Thermomicrobiales bacterium]